MEDQNLKEINVLVQRFFSLFTNTTGNKPQVDHIRHMFIEQGIIINATHSPAHIYDLEEFIVPRKELLSDGTLTDFSEWETSHNTTIVGNIAQRYICYQKSGKLNGEPFETKGVKNMQLIKTNEQWRIVSVTWFDEA
ncbi:hypothetical protein [uncultured Microscilla sp.]|uniref:hypothetical protein n=1 Tax=uncultured Microscilla sp. TaxID=432653 RepID=UPI0026047E71|nr:hypothetical protein [uncultured Microscilla sp.]